MPINQPSRREDTSQNYIKRVRILVRQFRKLHQIPDRELVDARVLVGWLAQGQAEKSRNTWKQYKNAFIAHFQQFRDPIADEAVAMLSQIYSSGGLKRGTKTSSTKLKRFPLKDLHQLRQALDKSKSQWATSVQRWIDVGILTGLRPQEWRLATMGQAEGEDALIVQNGKHSNGRTFGPQRSIILSLISPDEKSMIAEHIRLVKEWDDAGQYQHFYSSCSSTLNQSARRRWPKRSKYPTLYSCRHQFSANAKASGLTRFEIAALMGHLSPETAGIHYGRKLAGQEMIRVRPSAHEVGLIYSQQNTKKPEPKPHMALRPVISDKDRK